MLKPQDAEALPVMLITPVVVMTLEAYISNPPFVFARVPPVKVIEPEPLTDAVMLLNVSRPDPDNVMSPEEVKLPVGETVVPPVIESVPLLAVNEPAPS